MCFLAGLGLPMRFTIELKTSGRVLFKLLCAGLGLPMGLKVELKSSGRVFQILCAGLGLPMGLKLETMRSGRAPFQQQPTIAMRRFRLSNCASDRSEKEWPRSFPAAAKSCFAQACFYQLGLELKRRGAAALLYSSGQELPKAARSCQELSGAYIRNNNIK